MDGAVRVWRARAQRLDPRLLDVAGALEVLPELPPEHLRVNAGTGAKRMVAHESLRACVGAPPPFARGSAQRGDNRGLARLALHLARALAPTADSSEPALQAWKKLGCWRPTETSVERRASDARDKSNASLATAGGDSRRKRATGLEPATISLEG